MAKPPKSTRDNTQRPSAAHSTRTAKDRFRYFSTNLLALTRVKQRFLSPSREEAGATQPSMGPGSPQASSPRDGPLWLKLKAARCMPAQAALGRPQARNAGPELPSAGGAGPASQRKEVSRSQPSLERESSCVFTPNQHILLPLLLHPPFSFASCPTSPSPTSPSTTSASRRTRTPAVPTLLVPDSLALVLPAAPADMAGSSR